MSVLEIVFILAVSSQAMLCNLFQSILQSEFKLQEEINSRLVIMTNLETTFSSNLKFNKSKLISKTIRS